MAQLTTEELLFLREQKISLGQLFDATGLNKRDYGPAMKEADKHFAFGTDPCKTGGHRLRTRHGHCIQCNHARIGYALRPSQLGYVYIAGSHSRKLLKIGMTTDMFDRKAKLNGQQYGGANDWDILLEASTKNAGKCEFDAHKRLIQYRAEGTYIKAGKEQRCYELFRCSFKVAKSAVVTSLPPEATTRIYNETSAIELFS